ncbi:MAG: histidine phosphatase family protein [Bacteroidota bacterium]
MLSFYFIRHAESEANRDHSIICGRSDHMPLSAQGRIQKELLGERLKQENLQFDHFYSSLSVRALDTGKAVVKALGVDEEMIQITDQLVEQSKGDWEGKVRAEMYDMSVQRQLEKDSYTFYPPGGESQQAAEQRMINWLEATRQKHEGQSANIAAFSHGFAIKSMLAKLLKADTESVFSMMIHNTSLTVLQWNGQRWRLERINDFAHLQGTPVIGY